MILSFLLANFGYPVWEPTVSQGTVSLGNVSLGNAPLACQAKRCGCKSVENCCCTKRAKLSRVTCCSKTPTLAAKTTELRWVPAISAREWQGTGVDWIQAGFVAAPPRPMEFVILVPERSFNQEVFGTQSAPFSEPLFRPV